MKVYLLIISICIVFVVPTETLAMKRSERTKLPACLGGVCLGQAIKHLSDVSGTFFNRSVHKCIDDYPYKYTAEYKVEKTGSGVLSKNTLFVDTVSNNLKEGYKIKAIYRVIEYKLASLKTKGQQFAFVEDLIFKKYGKPFKVGKLHSFGNLMRKHYFYDIDYKSGAVDNNLITILSNEKNKDVVELHMIFGSTFFYFRSCMRDNEKKEKEQNLLPD